MYFCLSAGHAVKVYSTRGEHLREISADNEPIVNAFAVCSGVLLVAYGKNLPDVQLYRRCDGSLLGSLSLGDHDGRSLYGMLRHADRLLLVESERKCMYAVQLPAALLQTATVSACTCANCIS